MSGDVKRAWYMLSKHDVGTGKTVVKGRKLDVAADEGGGVEVGVALEDAIFPSWSLARVVTRVVKHSLLRQVV